MPNDARSRKAIAQDVGLAVAVFALELAGAVRSEWPSAASTGTGSSLPVSAWIVLVVAGGALAWRRRHPLVVLAATTAAVAAWHLVGHPDSPSLGLIVALYGTGRYIADLRRSVYAMAASGVVTVLVLVVDGDPLSSLTFAGVLVVAPWFVGRSVSARREYLELLEYRAASLEREREAALRQILADERTRIARELHDVVAHRVSLMTVQAGAAQTVIDDDPARAAGAMAAVEAAGRTALGELRHLLDVLRSDTDRESREPAPSLTDLPKLVDQLEDAGVSVTLTADADLAGLEAPVDLSAYRIVQESLTNVLRHAGPGARAAVDIGLDGDVLRIDVIDDGSGRPVMVNGAGRGVAGMRERAELLGGSLEAGPRETGGFRVRAILPRSGSR